MRLQNRTHSKLLLEETEKINADWGFMYLIISAVETAGCCVQHFAGLPFTPKCKNYESTDQMLQG